MKVLELFSGFECLSNAFRERGHECFTIDWDERFPSTMHCDISKLQIEDLPEEWRHPDVVFAGTQCFVKDSLIWTLDGYKNIQDISIGDYVLTHTGSYKKVYNTFVKESNDLYKIKIAGSEPIICTGDHPFYVRKKHGYSTRKGGYSHRVFELLNCEWIKAKDLNSEYRVGFPINIESKLISWDGVDIFVSNASTKPHILRHENNLSHLMDNNDFWYFVGRYVGDGYLSKPIEHKKNKYVMQLACPFNQTDDLDGIIKPLGMKYSIKNNGTCDSFMFANKELWTFLSKFGFGALNKHIPKEVLDLPVDLLKSFVDGYLSADGHWDYSLSNPVCSFTTVSRNLAYGLQQCILKCYKRYCSLFKTSNVNNNICGRKVNAHDAYILSFSKEETRRLQYTIENNMVWFNIKKIEQLSTNEKVYNFSVEDDESYTVNNVIVHNCTTYSIAAISRHRRKNPITGALEPISEQAKHDDAMNRHCIDLIKQMNPKIQIWENPMGAFRKMDFVQDLILNTTTYCQYSFSYRKQTDFLSNIDLHLKKPCKNGDSCHEKAPRGARTGLQAIKDPALKAIYPPELCKWIVKECEEYISNK